MGANDLAPRLRGAPRTSPGAERGEDSDGARGKGALTAHPFTREVPDGGHRRRWWTATVRRPVAPPMGNRGRRLTVVNVWDLETLGIGTAGGMILGLVAWSIAAALAALRARR